MKKLTINELNQHYTDAESVDKPVFSEQRSNVLLVSGDHYQKKDSKFWGRVRDSKQISEQQKLRLTKNHIQKIAKTYVNNIMSRSPGVRPFPNNPKELADQKAAELHHSIWQFISDKQKLKKKKREWCQNFVNIGEAAVKVFYDPNLGEIIGYEQEMDELGQPVFETDELGQPILDEQGQPKPQASDRPVFSGGFSFETIHGFNLLRSKEAKTMDESKFLCYRKMTDIKELEKMLEEDPDKEAKLKFLQGAHEDVYTVFDASRGSYDKTQGQVMVREFYFRPCGEYPSGYFYITTPQGVLWEGPLPFGIFPILYVGFDEIETTPRARSIIKQLRPYQAEINRCASQIATHQITLGDDKLMIQSGTKLAPGGQVPGVRGIQYSGMPPTVLPGRSGEQYVGYMESQIEEMYRISNVLEDSEEKVMQLEPMTMLYRNMKQQQKFSNYCEKFEGFLVEVCEVTLRLAKMSLKDDSLIPMIGKREMVNIAEFRSMDDLGFQIRLEPMSDDLETMMGKQMTLNHFLQYVGPQLGKDSIGQIMRAMPFANSEEAFSDLTLDYDNSVNDILALDRGEQVQAHQHDNHEYVIKRLINRMKQRDFEMLNPQIQQNYQAKLQEHEQVLAAQQAQIQAAKDGFIPTGGYMVTCDFYIQVDAKDPSKVKRVRLPYEAIQWLIKKLETQGTSFQNLENMHQSAVADIAQMVMSQQGNQQNPNPGQPQAPGAGMMQ